MIYNNNNDDEEKKRKRKRKLTANIEKTKRKIAFHEFLAYFLKFVNRTAQLDPIIYTYLNNEPY